MGFGDKNQTAITALKIVTASICKKESRFPLVAKGAMNNVSRACHGYLFFIQGSQTFLGQEFLLNRESFFLGFLHPL